MATLYGYVSIHFNPFIPSVPFEEQRQIVQTQNAAYDQGLHCLQKKNGLLFKGRYPVWQHTFVSLSAFSRRTVVSYWRKYVHEVLVNRLGGLSLLRKSVARLTDRPDMTLDVYRRRKTTIQQQQQNKVNQRALKLLIGSSNLSGIDV